MFVIVLILLVCFNFVFELLIRIVCVALWYNADSYCRTLPPQPAFIWNRSDTHWTILFLHFIHKKVGTKSICLSIKFKQSQNTILHITVLLFDLFADTYVKARKLSIVAEETSNVESTDETVTKRKRKEPATSDVEDGDGMCFIMS